MQHTAVSLRLAFHEPILSPEMIIEQNQTTALPGASINREVETYQIEQCTSNEIDEDKLFTDLDYCSIGEEEDSSFKEDAIDNLFIFSQISIDQRTESIRNFFALDNNFNTSEEKAEYIQNYINDIIEAGSDDEEVRYNAIMRIYEKILFHNNAVIHIFHDEIMLNIIYSYLDFHDMFCAEVVLFFIEVYIQKASSDIQYINKLNENTFNNVVYLLAKSLEESDSIQHTNKVLVTIWRIVHKWSYFASIITTEVLPIMITNTHELNQFNPLFIDHTYAIYISLLEELLKNLGSTYINEAMQMASFIVHYLFNDYFDEAKQQALHSVSSIIEYPSFSNTTLIIKEIFRTDKLSKLMSVVDENTCNCWKCFIGFIRSGYVDALITYGFIKILFVKIQNMVEKPNEVDVIHAKLVINALDNLLIFCRDERIIDQIIASNLINMLIFVSSNLIKSLKKHVLKMLTTFIHFTKRTEVLLTIDDFLPMLMHECHEINDSVHIFAIILLEELFQCNYSNHISLPTLSIEDQQFIQEIIDSDKEVTANLAKNIKNIIINN